MSGIGSTLIVSGTEVYDHQGNPLVGALSPSGPEPGRHALIMHMSISLLKPISLCHMQTSPYSVIAN